MISVDRVIMGIAAFALFALVAVEGALVYAGHRAIGEAETKAEKIVRRVSANTAELPAERELSRAGEVITLWEHLPVSEPLRAADFYPSPSTRRRPSR
jgi:hypothetical protein